MKILENGVKDYESLNELIEQGIVYAAEDKDNYYITVEPDHPYENSMWIVDKKTKKIDWMYFTEWLVDKSESCREIDPKNIKRD